MICNTSALPDLLALSHCILHCVPMPVDPVWLPNTPRYSLRWLPRAKALEFMVSHAHWNCYNTGHVLLLASQNKKFPVHQLLNIYFQNSIIVFINNKYFPAQKCLEDGLIRFPISKSCLETLLISFLQVKKYSLNMLNTFQFQKVSWTAF